MEALYERVLALVPTPQLHESYNTVLHEEYASVSQSLGNVLAAFAKLQEVRDAVSKLQRQSNEASSGGCSGDSVRASVDELVELQRQLQRQVERLALGMEVAMVGRKRKRVDAETAVVASVDTSVRNIAGGGNGRGVAVKKVKRIEVEDEVDVDVDSSCESSDEEEETTGTPQVITNEGVGSASGAKRGLAAVSGSESHSSSESGSEDEEGVSGKGTDEVEGSEAVWALTTEGRQNAASLETKTAPRPGNVAPGSELSPSSESESGDDEDESGDDEDESGDDEVEGSEAAWKALTTHGGLTAASPETRTAPAPAKKTKTTEAKTIVTTKPSKKTATYLKTILLVLNDFSPLDRSFIIPEVIAVLKESVEEDIGGVQHSDVASCLKIFLSWEDRQRGYDVQHVDLYREYAAVVESYVGRIPVSKRTVEMERLKHVLSQLDGRSMPNTTYNREDAMAAVREASERKVFSQVIRGTHKVAHERITTLLCLLVTFKKETAAGVSDTFGDRMIKVIAKTSRWLSEDFRDPTHLLVHRMVVDAFRAFSHRIPKISARDRVTGLLETLSEGISNSSQARTRKQLIELRNRAVKVFSDVKQHNGNYISPREAGQLVAAVRILMTDVTVGWIPCEDVAMRKCVQELKNILAQAQIQAGSDLKSRSSFKAYFTGVNKWKIEDPPAVVTAERKLKQMDGRAMTVQSGVDNEAGRPGSNAEATKTKKNKAISSTTPDVETDSFSCAIVMKTIVTSVSQRPPADRVFIIPDVLAALKEFVKKDVDGTHPGEVAFCMKAVVGWWAHEREDQSQYAEFYREYAAVVETYVGRLPISKPKSELRRFVDTLLSTVNNIDGRSKRHTKRCGNTEESRFVFSAVVKSRAAKPDRLRRWLVRVLVAFKKELASGAKVNYTERIFDPFTTVFQRLHKYHDDPVLKGIYRMLVRAAQASVIDIPDAAKRDPMYQLLEKMAEPVNDPFSLMTGIQSSFEKCRYVRGDQFR